MDFAPTRKMTAVAVGGAFATIIAWILSEYGIDMPDAVVAALTTILSFCLGWLQSDDSSDPLD